MLIRRLEVLEGYYEASKALKGLKMILQSLSLKEEHNFFRGWLAVNILVPCRGTAPNLTLDLNVKGHTHLFWDAREVTAEGSETPLRGSRTFSVSVPLYPATQSPSGVRGLSIVERLIRLGRSRASGALVSA